MLQRLFGGRRVFVRFHDKFSDFGGKFTYQLFAEKLVILLMIFVMTSVLSFAGAWTGRAIGGTTASEVTGILIGKAVVGGVVALGVAVKGPKVAVGVLKATNFIEEIEKRITAQPNQDTLIEAIIRRKMVADVFNELAIDQEASRIIRELTEAGAPVMRAIVNQRAIARANTDIVYAGKRKPCHAKTLLR